MTDNKQYPEMPEPTAWRSYDNLLKRARYNAVPITSMQPGIYSHTRMFTEDQMYAYVDADRAMRAAPAAPAIVAGDAVFAFASMLTTLPYVVPFGSCAWATPGAELASAFNAANGLNVSRDFPTGLVFPKIEGDLLACIEKASALVEALRNAQCAIQSMKAEAETAAQGDEQMMLEACEQISNEGLDAWMAIQSTLAAAPKAEPAPVSQEAIDDAAVDALVVKMKSKLARKRAEGRGGWDEKDTCSQEYLSRLLRMHVDKGDPIDVANFCAFLAARGEGIAPVAQGDALDQGVREELSIGKAINRAARDLPEGWVIRIDLERRAGVVFLIDPDGNETMSEGGELFSDQINAAIDAARTQQEDKSGANHDL